ncbi:MAG: ABC transporter substrate binding protein [Pseudomonadota bacterium]
MLRKLFIIITLVLIFGSGLAQAGQKILAVQSLSVKPYEDAIAGFESVCDAEMIRVILSEQKESDLLKNIDATKPEMVLAIGMDALEKVKGIGDIPVIYLMVLNPQSILAEKTNISGVSMNISQERQLSTLLEVLPETKSVGLLYNPDRTEEFVNSAKEAARKNGITLVTEKIHSSREVLYSIKKLKGKIEVFWMIPDITVLTPETVELLLLFSLENNLPILAFSEKHVELGALLSVGIDAFDIGAQAGEMAEEILSGNSTVNGKQVNPRKGVVTINLKIARKLGITIDEKILRKVKKID